MTMNLPIENLSPFARIAQIYCPNVYEQLNILIFCLSISFVCILILLLAGTYLSHLTSIRTIILALQHKFNISM
jgi:hypothetical protein